ncbi:Two-pore potassium channel 1 [Apostasia shenzhenica]|uniref:Two-pore potassium channel 1 n=1 Tax=Apostasia shenzhenica TaxID=1088818 RepID=A0A2I0AND4_9ASPA|nr:Two-pore potassium channel 1 [Apostasia shenzhenica]
MAEDSAKQHLLSCLEVPQQQPQKLGAAKKRRIRRCKSAPSAEVYCGQNKDCGWIAGSHRTFKSFWPSFQPVAFFFAIYLVVSTTCFYLVRHQLDGKKTNGVLDALYFCIVTMTTVGYGDLVPHSVAAKLLACAFVFTGMAIVALFLGKAADYLLEKQEVLLVKALHIRQKAGKMQMLKEIETNKVKYKFFMTSASLLFLVVLGIFVLLKVERLNLIDAFYCVCATITTLGYGDKSFSTIGGRIFAVFWILTSTIFVAQFFLYLAEMNTEFRQQSLIKWVLTRRMTFVDLEAADLDDDGVLSAAEFVIYKLKEMGKISQEDVAIVMEEFETLDVDQSGTISNSDLVLAQHDV